MKHERNLTPAGESVEKVALAGIERAARMIAGYATNGRRDYAQLAAQYRGSGGLIYVTNAAMRDLLSSLAALDRARTMRAGK